VRILALDGGGTKGVIEVEFLKKIEALIAPIPLREYFDLICGTSTGGLISLALVYLKKDAAGIEAFYDTCVEEIFPCQNTIGKVARWVSGSETASSSGFTSLLNREFGEKILVEELTPKVFVVSTKVTSQEHEMTLFGNFKARDVRVGDEVAVAARSTAAAPTYFKTVHVGQELFQDGGLVANNPTEVAILMSNTYIWPGRPIDLVVSLGTGKSPKAAKAAAPKHSSSTEASEQLLGLIQGVIKTSTNCQATHKKIQRHRTLLHEGSCYVRLNIRLPPTFQSMDTTDKQALAEIKEIAKNQELPAELASFSH